MVRAFRQSQGADLSDPAQVEWRSQKAMEGPGCPAEGEAAAWLVPKGPLQGTLLDSSSCPGETGSRQWQWGGQAGWAGDVGLRQWKRLAESLEP